MEKIIYVVKRYEDTDEGMIDFYVRHVNYQNATDTENKVVRTAYEEYP